MSDVWIQKLIIYIAKIIYHKKNDPVKTTTIVRNLFNKCSDENMRANRLNIAYDIFDFLVVNKDFVDNRSNFKNIILKKLKSLDQSEPEDFGKYIKFFNREVTEITYIKNQKLILLTPKI